METGQLDLHRGARMPVETYPHLKKTKKKSERKTVVAKVTNSLPPPPTGRDSRQLLTSSGRQGASNAAAMKMEAEVIVA